MKWKHRGAIQIIRHMVQLAAFILFPELFITVLQALGDVIAALVNGTFYQNEYIPKNANSIFLIT